MDLILSYNFLKTIHIISFTTWMAGLFYLPRLFVYHSKENKNSKTYSTFIIMEKKLLKYIMNPSFIITFVSGLILVLQTKQYEERWFIIKFLLVVSMSVFHMYCAKVRISVEKMLNEKDEKFFRIINEIPTILFLGIVVIVVFKPFN